MNIYWFIDNQTCFCTKVTECLKTTNMPLRTTVGHPTFLISSNLGLSFAVLFSVVLSTEFKIVTERQH